MGKTNFDRITASPEVLAAFLASLPCLDAPWDDAFHRVFCDNCPMATTSVSPRHSRRSPSITAAAPCSTISRSMIPRSSRLTP